MAYVELLGPCLPPSVCACHSRFAQHPLCVFLGLNLTEKLRWTMIADDAAEFLGQCCTEEKPLGGLRWSLAQDVHDQPQFGLYTQR